MFLLRTITNDTSGKFLADRWYQLDTLPEVVDIIIKAAFDNFECFTAENITDTIDTGVEREALRREKEVRRLSYEKLRLEFEPVLET